MTPLAFIPSPSSNGFSVGPLFFHAYGIAYVFAVAAAILIARWRWRAVGGDPDLPYEVAMWAFPAGLIGGRIYFDITTPSQIPDHWWGVFAIWDGGLGIWGGIAGGVIGGLWVIRRRLSHDDLLRFMDAAAPGLLVAQAIGRIGNYFNQELFGAPTKLFFGLKISPAHRPPGYEQLRHVRAHLPVRADLEPRASPAFWCGSARGARCARRACSRSTWPATRPSASSRRRSGSTTPTTSSGCGSTSGSRWPCACSASPGSRPCSADGGGWAPRPARPRRPRASGARDAPAAPSAQRRPPPRPPRAKRAR